MIAALLLTLALQDATVPTVQPKPKPERRICRPVVNTGSRMAKARECRTAAEWSRTEGGVDSSAMDQMKRASSGVR